MSCCCTARPTNNKRLKQRWTRRYMPTLRTVTVKSAGGDYSSLSSAEAGEQGDLVSLDRQLDIECYSMADTTAVTIIGWTTDATRYVRIVAPSAERHAGVWSTSKYRLSVASAFTTILNVNEEFVRIEGLQVEGTDNTANGHGLLSVDSIAVAASSDVRVDTCLFRKGCSRNASHQIACGAGKTTIRNSVVYGSLGSTASDGINCTFGANAATVICDNVTVASAGRYGFNRVSGTMTLQNCYTGGNGTDAYNGTITRTTCAHSSASVFTGSTASIAHSTANFTNVTAGSEDYHLVSGASATLKTGGTDLSGTFTTDIDGETRSAPYSIGADQIVSAAAAGSCPLASRILSGSCFGGRGVILCL